MKGLNLLKQTVAYKLIEGDRRANALCHAYLVISQDGKYLRDTLKEFAKIIMSGSVGGYFGGEVEDQRVFSLIDSEKFVDATFIPEEDKKITVADIDLLIADSIVKPFEADKRLFVLCLNEPMSPDAQNKLLKTLEEPPENVYILIGALNETAILPTIKSRVRKLTIPPYSDKDLISELSPYCVGEERLALAVASSDGTVGDAERLYEDRELIGHYSLAKEIICSMKESKDVLAYSVKLNYLKEKLNEFIDVLELVFKDLLEGVTAGEKYVKNLSLYRELDKTGLSAGALVGILSKISEAKKRRNANANDVMVADFLLYGILEEKYKWQKL